jgi:DNA-binding MarR family transcriptional regulator
MMITANDLILAHSLRDMAAKLNRMLRKQISNPEELSVTEENLVRLLVDQAEVMPSSLCMQLNISSQFMSQVLNRLEKLDYISRIASKTDKRKSLVSISKTGLIKLQQRRKAKEEFLATLISRLYDKKQKNQLAASIPLMARLYEAQ